MNLEFFRRMLEMESTSGTERGFAEFLWENVRADFRERYEVGDGTLNLLFKWGEGEPQIYLCSHMDTVPPYISPTFRDIKAGDALPDGKIAEQDDILITGRGSCDAKGQIFAMLEACLSVHSERANATSGLATCDPHLDGKSSDRISLRDLPPQEIDSQNVRPELENLTMSDDRTPAFALLLLSGEETGSYGAKAYTRDCSGGKWLVVGEPTDNKMVTASKGTKSFGLTIKGKPCHSGYPELGTSAVDKFVGFVNALRQVDFPVDPTLGPTTWNIGKLISDNPQNILSPELKFRIYFRTTFLTDDMVTEWMRETAKEHGYILEEYGGDTPMRYDTLDNFETTPVAFGSDTPRMTKFIHRSLCGPGSIFVAHTPDEYILKSDLDKAIDQYRLMIYSSFASAKHLF